MKESPHRSKHVGPLWFDSRRFRGINVESNTYQPIIALSFAGNRIDLDPVPVTWLRSEKKTGFVYSGFTASSVFDIHLHGPGLQIGKGGKSRVPLSPFRHFLQCRWLVSFSISGPHSPAPLHSLTVVSQAAGLSLSGKRLRSPRFSFHFWWVDSIPSIPRTFGVVRDLYVFASRSFSSIATNSAYQQDCCNVLPQGRTVSQELSRTVVPLTINASGWSLSCELS